MQLVMLGFSAFKRKPRQFNYIPRYWNQEQEERERRLHPDEETQKPYVPGALIKDSRTRRLYGAGKKKGTGSSPVLIRTVIVLMLLGLVGWIIFRTPMVDLFVMGLTAR